MNSSSDINSNKIEEISDDNEIFLSAEALKALQEFYAESEAKEKKIDENWVHI